MGRRVVPLTLDLLDRLDPSTSPCRTCLTWALDPVRRSRLDPGDAAAHAEAKDGWVSELLREWGSCGRVVLHEHDPVGLVLYAPPALVPGAASVPTAPASPDSVLVTDVWVHPDLRGRGLGRLLVQGTARDLVSRGGIRAVEVFAAAAGDAPECLAPVDFWLRTGFRTHRPHPVVPRLRMDLRSTVTWMDEVEAALERLVGAVRPAPVPSPDARIPAVRRDDGDARCTAQVSDWVSTRRSRPRSSVAPLARPPSRSPLARPPQAV